MNEDPRVRLSALPSEAMKNMHPLPVAIRQSTLHLQACSLRLASSALCTLHSAAIATAAAYQASPWNQPMTGK